MQTTSAKTEIRTAVASDAADIGFVLYESFIEYKSLYNPERFAATTATAEQIQNRMNEGPIWVALINGVTSGTLSAVANEQTLYIRGMGVLPAARGQRIGKLLLDHAEQFAVAQGYKRLRLNTNPFLDHAIQLYERAGFRRSDEGPHELFGAPLIAMEKTLG